jgi:hypothetical protein
MKRISWVCILVLAAPARSDEPKPPEPPKGFSWKKVDEIKASFLMPDGWHYRLDSKGKTTAVFITREKIEEGKLFKTGLSVNVVRGLKDGTAEKLAQSTVAALAKEGKVEDAFDVKVGKLKGSGGRLTISSKNVTMQFLVLANTTTNTLHIIQFESPEKEWKEAWKTGMTIMEKLGLDDDV